MSGLHRERPHTPPAHTHPLRLPGDNPESASWGGGWGEPASVLISGPKQFPNAANTPSPEDSSPGFRENTQFNFLKIEPQEPFQALPEESSSPKLGGAALVQLNNSSPEYLSFSAQVCEDGRENGENLISEARFSEMYGNPFLSNHRRHSSNH